MNARQKKKAFKKKYGVTQKQCFDALAKINTQEFFDSLGESIKNLMEYTNEVVKTTVDLIQSDTFQKILYEAVKNSKQGT